MKYAIISEFCKIEKIIIKQKILNRKKFISIQYVLNKIFELLNYDLHDYINYPLINRNLIQNYDQL